MDKYQPLLDSTFHALADPTRRKVVLQLGKGPASVSELAASFDMALPSFMKHISVLEEAGLIHSQKIGRVRTCTLNRENFSASELWFAQQREIWASRNDNLNQLLTQLKDEQS